MSKKIVAVVPENVRVSTSTSAAQVILSIEILLEGESPGDPSGENKYILGPHQAISLGRQLQDRSIQLLLSLAGYEVPPDTNS